MSFFLADAIENGHSILIPFFSRSWTIAMIGSFMRWYAPGATYLLTGRVLYPVGTMLVTMLFNVPRNNALAILAPTSPEAARVWASYLSRWTAWNHVRTISALTAAVSFTLALRFRA